MRVNNNTSLRGAAAVALLAAALAGCGHKQAQGPAGAMGPGGAMPPAEVGVVTIAPRSLPVTSELPGRLSAVRTAQVRARVAGVLQRQLAQGGADVKAGQVLFQIDPAPLKAALDSAQASLAKASAIQAQAREKAERYKALADINAVSKLDYVNAVAAAQQADADVAAARAAVTTARLNLGYAAVQAPITGRLGTPQVTEGALVGQGDATLLATIQQLDNMYLDVTESSADLLKLRRQFDNGQLKGVQGNAANVTLMLDDGTAYPYPGKLLFSDATVDPSTGMVTLRAEFPNPKHLLLPGMYARARLEQAVRNDALTVPQRGVALGPNGSATVMVVGADGKVAVRPVTLGAATGTDWIVTGGLNAGDRVIVEGLQKAKPGAVVKPVPFAGDAPAVPAAPQAK